MNLKLIILGALAYTLFFKKQGVAPSQPAVQAPTQAEINAKLMQSAQDAMKQAQDVISSIGV